MKNIKLLIVGLFSLCVFIESAFAASCSLQVSKTSVYVGDTFTVSANMSGAASWDIHVSASGPVSGCVINQANASDDASDINKTFSATCTATGVGVITLTMSGDITSAQDSNNAISIGGSKTVTVSTKPSTPTPSPAPSNNNTNNNSTTKKNTTNKETNTKSTNTNISKLSIEGYELNKIDNNNYSLSVPYNVENINIIATLEDSKSTITGVGNHTLIEGENKIELLVISESGNKSTYIITVNRNSFYTLDDLDNILNTDLNNIKVRINLDSSITKSMINKIVKSKKNIYFSYYNEDKLLYSIKINGISKGDYLTTLEILNNEEIFKKTNYASGIYLTSKSKYLPSNIDIKYYVKDIYNDKELVNIYTYKNNKLVLVEKNVSVKDGYIEFTSKNNKDLIITKASFINKESNNSKSSNIILYFIIGILVIIDGIMIFFYIKKGKIKATSN
jgi:hypothetical protein